MPGGAPRPPGPAGRFCRAAGPAKRERLPELRNLRRGIDLRWIEALPTSDNINSVVFIRADVERNALTLHDLRDFASDRDHATVVVPLRAWSNRVHKPDGGSSEWEGFPGCRLFHHPPPQKLSHSRVRAIGRHPAVSWEIVVAGPLPPAGDAADGRERVRAGTGIPMRTAWAQEGAPRVPLFHVERCGEGVGKMEGRSAGDTVGGRWSTALDGMAWLACGAGALAAPLGGAACGWMILDGREGDAAERDGAAGEGAGEGVDGAEVRGCEVCGHVWMP